jgi:hypothetical protein
MSADIPSIDSNPEVVRLGRLIATYKSRLVELARIREQISMADEVSQVLARAQSLAAGGRFEPVRDAASVDDEARVVRAAIGRIERQTVDARSVAVLTISKQCRLPERAAASRGKVAAACAALMVAIDEAQALAGGMDAADISPTGPRWTGCPAPGLPEMVASLALECSEGLDAKAVHALQRKAGILIEPVYSELPAALAPAPKPSIRKRVAAALDEIGVQMIG